MIDHLVKNGGKLKRSLDCHQNLIDWSQGLGHASPLKSAEYKPTDCTGFSGMSGWFSPLTAPLPFCDLPLRAPLVYSDCSAHLNFWPAPFSAPLTLRCNALLLRSHDCLCQYVRSALPTQVLFYVVLLYWQLQHKICIKSQDLALKISKIFRGTTPGPPRRDPRFQKRSRKSKIATTPLYTTLWIWNITQFSKTAPDRQQGKGTSSTHALKRTRLPQMSWY